METRTTVQTANEILTGKLFLFQDNGAKNINPSK